MRFHLLRQLKQQHFSDSRSFISLIDGGHLLLLASELIKKRFHLVIFRSLFEHKSLPWSLEMGVMRNAAQCRDDLKDRGKRWKMSVKFINLNVWQVKVTDFDWMKIRMSQKRLMSALVTYRLSVVLPDRQRRSTKGGDPLPLVWEAGYCAFFAFM